jgi:hypothetical protein
MTAVEPRVLRLAPSDSPCWWCKGSGYLPNREWCTCDGRPFGDEVDPDSPFTVRESGPTKVGPRSEVMLPARSELEAATDMALMWSTDFLSALVRLSHWVPYLRGGGPQVPAAECALHAVRSIQAAADDLFAVTDRLALTAQNVLDGELGRFNPPTTKEEPK